jgi:hypothetical protein
MTTTYERLSTDEQRVYDSLNIADQIAFLHRPALRALRMKEFEQSIDWGPSGVASADEFDDLTAAAVVIEHARASSASATDQAAPVEQHVAASAGDAAQPPPALLGATAGNGALVFTKVSNKRGSLTKTYSLGADGKPKKTTAAKLYEGHAERMECADIAEFMARRATLESHEALLYGVAERASVSITTQSELKGRPALRGTHIARDAEHMHYAKAPGVVMFDHDPEHCEREFDRTSLRAAMLEAVPGLDLAPMAWATSASSCIVNEQTGDVLQGLRGQRLYVPVADATDIPRIGKVIYERLWAAGFGRFVVSKAGALLDRNIVDASAWTPERIDFAAGAKCMPPLVQSAPPWHVWGAGLMGGLDPWNSRTLPDLTDAEREAAARNRTTARAAKASEAAAAREAYIVERGSALAADRGIDAEAGVALVREAVERSLLFADFLLHPEDGEPVTVGAVLDDPVRWHGARFADPLEHDYRSDMRIAWCNLRSGGRPYLYSHAHGIGQRYELVRQPARLQIQPGGDARLVDDCLRIMRERGDVYDFGSSDTAEVVGEGRVRVSGVVNLLDYLNRHVRFTRFDKRARKEDDPWWPTSCPESVAKTIAARSGERELPKLRGVITAPTLRADGSVLDAPGYDVGTGLFYVEHGDAARVNSTPSKQEVEDALEALWKPVSQFPFADAHARGVVLAALLTACVRRGLPRAPGIAIDAPTAGTGKSLLAETILALGGHSSSSHVPPTGDEETGKVLFSLLREGAGAVYFDNFTGVVGGKAIDQFLTAELYSGRVLGLSKNEGGLPNGALFVVTGNNLQIAGDTCRRMLVCRLDARIEDPHRRSFAFEPRHYVSRHRARLVAAALTLMRGYITSGATPVGRPLGSFEQWDGLVRQTVCWLAATQSKVELDDPNVTTEHSGANDETKNLLGVMLAAWRGAFGSTPHTTGEALVFLNDFDKAGEDKRAEREALKAAIAQLPRPPKVEVDAKRLGIWLTTSRDRVVGGMRFESRARRNVKDWVVV